MIPHDPSKPAPSDQQIWDVPNPLSLDELRRHSHDCQHSARGWNRLECGGFDTFSSFFIFFFTYFSWSAVDGFTHPRPTQKGCFCDGSSWRRQAAKPWACRSAGTEIKNSLQEKGNVSIRPCLIIHAVILLQVDWNQSGEGWVGGREHK